jgi:TIR domain/Pentapeptide repeats (8 copies)
MLHANLINAKLSHAGLIGTKLFDADLSGAFFLMADLSGANLSEANLKGANLYRADLFHADLSGANLSEATLSGTIFGDVDLGKTIGLGNCKHAGPSIIDFATLSRSENLPISFLRGCGLPDNLIEYLPSLRSEAIRFYSCFMSYSSKDQIFADRLYADLQNNGVRCWFAPQDLRIGAKTLDAIDEAIRLRDKLLVILSEASIASDWVEDEVNKAYAEERERKETVLFPIRIDDVVMTTTEPWARKLRDQRNIGDFREWRNPDAYQKSLDRLLRDLKAGGAK